MKAHGDDDNDVSKELKQCMSKIVLQKKKESEKAKKKAEEAKNRPKI